jgi:hypothetical protein
MIKKFKICAMQFRQDLHDMEATLEQHHKIGLFVELFATFTTTNSDERC